MSDPNGWVPIGPSVVPNGQLGDGHGTGPCSGRCSAIAIERGAGAQTMLRRRRRRRGLEVDGQRRLLDTEDGFRGVSRRRVHRHRSGEPAAHLRRHGRGQHQPRPGEGCRDSRVGRWRGHLDAARQRGFRGQTDRPHCRGPTLARRSVRGDVRWFVPIARLGSHMESTPRSGRVDHLDHRHPSGRVGSGQQAAVCGGRHRRRLSPRWGWRVCQVG